MDILIENIKTNDTGHAGLSFVVNEFTDKKSSHNVSLAPGINADMIIDGDNCSWVNQINFAKTFTQETAKTWLEENIDAITGHLYTVKDVEIFSVGVWNGHDITQADLVDMVECFKATGKTVAPFLKLGHDNSQKLLASEGLPAAGWVSGLRINGSKLVADFVDIPKKIYALIKAKAYRSVSSEIYNNVNIGGQKYRKMLSAVALLGAETPAVMDLAGILSLYTAVPFTNDTSPDIIEFNKSESITIKAATMDEELAIEKAKTEKLQKENDALQLFKSNHEAEIAALKVEKFVTGLEAEKLVTPAMKPFITALFENKESYSFDKRVLTREDLVKEILALSVESAKLNFAAATVVGDKDANKMTGDVVTEKVKKFASDNKISLAEAYRQTDGGSKL